MKLKTKQFEKRHGFTIIELLTVMSIIVILFGLLVPAMTLVKTYAKVVKQQAQFHAIEAGLQMFHDDFGAYPPSDSMDRKETGGPDNTTKGYPGAIKLAEALMGQDLLGFHPSSIFKADGTNPLLTQPLDDLYPDNIDPKNPTDIHRDNLRSRKGPYLDITRVSTAAIGALYSKQTLANLVICDEFPRVSIAGAGRRVGLPVLYYKANVSSMLDPDPNGGTLPANPDSTTYIYNHLDNQSLIELTPAWTTDTTIKNPWANNETPGMVGFYTAIQNPKISSPPKPYNPDTYILMSAGPDGLYGTRDDVLNFEKQ